jgi:hypothetical protein
MPIIDLNLSLDNTATTDVLDVTFTPTADALLAAADAIVKYENA